MKIFQLFFVAVLAVLITSCGVSSVRFSEPQPPGAKTLEEFPKEYLGEYDRLSDSTIIGDFDLEYPLISEDSAIRIKAKNHVGIEPTLVINYLQGLLTIDFTSFKDADTKSLYGNAAVIDTLIRMYYYNAKYQYEQLSISDSMATFNITLADTMFNCSESHLIKKHKGALYLNVASREDAWKVFRIGLDKTGRLTFSSISEDDAVILKRIMEVNEEKTATDLLKPSKKTFSQFLKLKGFEHTIALKRKP